MPDPHILLIEDDPDIAEALRYNLTKSGYQVTHALNGRLARAVLEERVPDLVLLDLMLPDVSGLDLCKEIREGLKTDRVPVLMLTAKGEEADRIAGFDAGADDYVAKPFSIEELLRRIRALLRRSSAKRGNVVRIRDLMLDLSVQRALLHSKDLQLTAIEFKLLWQLLENPKTTLTREYLLERVWGYPDDLRTRTVDVHLRRLREKLGDYADIIETVRGEGYRYNFSEYGEP